jgi:hypothetical protein
VGGADALRCAACGVAAAVVAPQVGRARRFYAAYGVASCCVGVVVGVVAPRGCRVRGRCTVCGIAAAVIAPRGCRVRGRCTMCGIAAAVIAPRVGHRRRLCVACGVAAAVVAPRVGRARRLCAACVSRSWSSHCVGVAVAVVAPRVGRRRHLCAACGVAVAAIGPRGRCGHSRRAVWRCGRGGCRRAAWCRSCSCCHWTTKEDVSRKKRKENVQAGRRGACSREGHGDVMPSRSVVGLVGSRGRGRRRVAFPPSCCGNPNPMGHGYLTQSF